MRETIDSIFNYNPERHYDIRECLILIRYAYYDFFEYEFFYLIKIVDMKIREGIIAVDDDGVIENIYYEYVVAIKEMIDYLKSKKKDFSVLEILLEEFIILGWDEK